MIFSIWSKKKPDHVELVFRGRKADPKLIEAADLLTEMKKIKHYYTQGVLARTGIEDWEPPLRVLSLQFIFQPIIKELNPV